MLERAIQIAVNAHFGQIDKAGKPYILHPMRVMLSGTTQEEMICGILHDVVEDTPITLEDLQKEGFSPDILQALKLLTRLEHTPYMEYIESISHNPLAIRVKLNDLKDNLNRDRIPNWTPHDEERHQKYIQAQKILLAALES